MQQLLQWFSVLLIAVGAGLNSFSSVLEPPITMANLTAAPWHAGDYESREQHLMAAVTAGIGVGLMTLGAFGLILPLLRRLLTDSCQNLSDNSARIVAMVAVWMAAAGTLTWGVFRVSWAGAGGTAAVLLIVATICASAVAATAMVQGWRPWERRDPPAASMD